MKWEPYEELDGLCRYIVFKFPTKPPAVALHRRNGISVICHDIDHDEEPTHFCELPEGT